MDNTVPIRQRLMSSDTWLLELFLSSFTTVWSAGLVNPWTDTFTNSPAYRVLSQFPGGELVFGLIGFFIGGMSMYAIINSTRTMRKGTLAANGVFWVFTTASFLVATLGNSGAVPYFVLVCLANWFCWVRLSFRGIV